MPSVPGNERVGHGAYCYLQARLVRWIAALDINRCRYDSLPTVFQKGEQHSGGPRIEAQVPIGAILIGRTLSHYRITAALGAGGMGEVYRATDTRLGRDVALKVLPGEMASSPERLERFRREAQALAALDHPGIVTVYSVEEHDGVPFLTMQLVEGKALDRVVEEGELAVDRLLALATSLAEALAAAHDKGIVHRDLKPANVMLTRDGRVKVLDFGLAKMGASSDAAASSELLTQLQTQEGAVMGTVPYMSPEQVRGRQLDSRSDLFSFGVLLYEMATGQHPFAGESPGETASAILRDTPPPPNDLRGDLPAGLTKAIVRSLEKAPEDRYETAQHLLEALHDNSKAPSVEEAPAEPPRIAVLPFSNLSGDPEQEYFSDGMAEEVLNALAGVPGLRVAARSSAFSFKGQNVDVRTIGEKLEVGHVLEGSVRRAGSRLRINAQLVNASDGYQLWSEVFDREMTDIFEVQEEIAWAIVSALRSQLALEPETSLLVQPGTSNLEAYNLYLRGRHQLGTVSPEPVRQAIRDLEQAVAADPEFADAWGPSPGPGHRWTCGCLLANRTSRCRKRSIAPWLSTPTTPQGWPARPGTSRGQPATGGRPRSSIFDAWEPSSRTRSPSTSTPELSCWPRDGSTRPPLFFAERSRPTRSTCISARPWPGTCWWIDGLKMP